jgi:RimJ/RimL family protein N-acetyltransferase
MDTLSALETERLLLRPWRIEDAVVQHALWAERDTRVPAHRRLDVDGHPTVEDLEQRIRDGRQPGLLAAVLRETGEMIGYCGLIDGEPEPEIAYEFLRATWGRGYATEAAQAVVDEARARGYRRLGAGVRVWNTASLRVLDKLGFVITDRVEPDPVHGDSVFTTREL